MVGAKLTVAARGQFSRVCVCVPDGAFFHLHLLFTLRSFEAALCRFHFKQKNPEIKANDQLGKVKDESKRLEEKSPVADPPQHEPQTPAAALRALSFQKAAYVRANKTLVDTLTITIFQAKDLPGGDLLGGCQPYVHLCVGDSEKTTKVKKSR